MKVKTSVTLTQELLHEIDDLPTRYRNRSFLLETAAWAFILHLRREAQAARDLEILNGRADYLNEEMSDVLAFLTFHASRFSYAASK